MKQKSFLMILVCMLSLLLCVGCGAKEAPKTEVETPAEPEKVTYVSPLTGEEREKKYPARPLVVSIDNVGDAIPQSWLSKADLIYEFPVEGEQTRLQAIYYSQFPKEFGPIRSTRPYFVDLAREYKAIFLAHGWSPAAREYLLSDVVPYINAMNSDCDFYRVADKEAPHDSYIKWSEVKDKIEEKGWWNKKKKIRAFKFLDENEIPFGEDATNIHFLYGSADYRFKYDAETNLYTRSVEGETHIDKETGKALKASNVLVQCVSSYVYDSKGRLEIDMCAGGDAILFTGGKAIKGSWSRKDLDSRTIFKDEQGNEFKLNVGNTWVEIVDQNCDLSYTAPEK